MYIQICIYMRDIYTYICIYTYVYTHTHIYIHKGILFSLTKERFFLPFATVWVNPEDIVLS